MKETTFEDFGLSNSTLLAIKDKGFDKPTPIQKLTIPILLGNDTNIIAKAQTGTGKTSAFALPLIELINPDVKTVQALILAPTRELAIQVSDEIHFLCKGSGLKTIPIYGGQSTDQQLRRLKKGVHIVVGTPGRIIDHLMRKTLKIDNIQHLILDEADEMLNMGFIDDIKKIMEYTNEDKRVLMFSATIPKRIEKLAKKYMGSYELIECENDGITSDLTEQIYYEVRETDKFEALCRIIDIEEEFYGLIFCRTKLNTDRLANKLMSRGYDAESIHSDISQAQRERTLNKFRERKVNILVATDVAARGLDVTELTHVINYSLPQDPESYVHRIGRTGRAGNEGIAIMFVTPNEYRGLKYIEKIAQTDIKRSSVPNIDDVITAKKRKIEEEIEQAINNDIGKEYYNWAKKILEKKNPTDVLASILNFSFDDVLNRSVYSSIADNPKTHNKREIKLKGKARLFVALGKKDNLNARKMVDLVTEKANIKPKQISDIQVMDKFSFITVPFKEAESIIQTFKQKGRKPLITHAKKKNNDNHQSKKR
jgi:ATP-dependent RNA helicase DeaD